MTSEEYDKLKDEEIRIKVAELRGCRQKRFHPDYLNDLNACHEFEKLLDVDIDSPDSPRYRYADWLYRVTPNDTQPFRATARQRCKAFVLTREAK